MHKQAKRNDQATNGTLRPKMIGSQYSQFYRLCAIFIFMVSVVIMPVTPAQADKASPEIGFGDKTDAQIMKENLRLPRIGVLGPMEGDLKFYGIEASNGAELASDELNAAGGVGGQEFELLVYDTKGSIAGARNGVDAFIKHQALAVVGAATGEVSFSSNKALNESQLIMVSAGSRRRLGDTGPYNFRITLNDSDGIRELVTYVIEEKKLKKFVLFSSVINDYSIKLSAAFKKELLKKNVEVLEELYIWSPEMSNIMPEERGVKGQIKRLEGKTPDAIIFTGDGKEAAELLRELEKLGMRVPLIGGEDLMVEEFTSMGEKAAGSMIYSGFDADSQEPNVKAFVDTYTKRFGKAPSRLAALSYDAYKMVAAAVEKSESLRPSHIRKSLLATRDFDGVTGKTAMSPTGEAIKGSFIFEFAKKGNGYSFVSVKSPF